MCGIGLLIAPSTEHQQEHAERDGALTRLHRAWPSALHNLRRRGPDCLRTEHHHFETLTNGTNHSKAWTLSLTSSVLSLRGDGTTSQPLSSPDGRLLLAWNGQIFDWDTPAGSSEHASSSRTRLDAGENDGIILLDRIQSLLEEQRGGGRETSSEQALNAALTEVEGPYAFVLFDRLESKLFYGRDPLGRRSLLLHRSSNASSIAIVSVASRDLLDTIQAESSETPLTEIACSSIWAIDLLQDPISPRRVPRSTSQFTSPLLLRELRPSNEDVQGPEQSLPVYDPTDTSSIAKVRADFLNVLAESVRRRATDINTHQPADEAHVAVLFSGGLDCTTLALLADRYVPPDQPIDLLNVGFENVRAIEAAKHEREKRLRASLKPANKKHGKGRLGNSVGSNGDAHRSTELRAPEQSPAVEEEETSNDIYAVPDRITGLASYAELCQLAPNRRWNFVEINVPYTEHTAHRAEVETLMFPTSSVMDLSIGSALYFASRAQGHIRPPPPAAGDVRLYTSPAKVLISGLGADELLGGYSRHRQAYVRDSLAGLISELQLDLDRLPERNLGRDDRILSCHGKESRYPYLDRSVLDFLTSIPVEAKVDLARIGTEGAGGDKRLLRDVARELGLEGASELKKRAMQFGTRSAKIDHESRNVKGHHKLS